MKATHGHPASDLPKLMQDADFAVFHAPSFPPLPAGTASAWGVSLGKGEGENTPVFPTRLQAPLLIL